MTRAKKILSHPLKTAELVNRRYFRLGLRLRDPDIRYMQGWCYGSLKREPLPQIFPGIENASYTVLGGFQRTENISLSLLELNAVLAILQHIQAKSVVEIGTFDGGTALNIAANLPERGIVHTIDLPPEHASPLALGISGFNDNRTELKAVGHLYKGTAHASKIHQVLADSATIDYASLNPPFDAFLIDGCHDYEYVKHDSAQAMRHTRPGGVIIWHDYGMLKDVSRHVDELSNQEPVRVVSGTRLAVLIKGEKKES